MIYGVMRNSKDAPAPLKLTDGKAYLIKKLYMLEGRVIGSITHDDNQLSIRCDRNGFVGLWRPKDKNLESLLTWIAKLD